MQTLESLTRQIVGAGELKSVVRTMKAMAASNIGQYQAAAASLENYYNMVSLGIVAYFNNAKIPSTLENRPQKAAEEKTICAIVFGSDQGFVGQFNDSLSEYVSQSLETFSGKKEIWTVGARIPVLLKDLGFNVTKKFPLPNSVKAISNLIGSILLSVEEHHENSQLNEFYIFHNHFKSELIYSPKSQKLLPLEQSWKEELMDLKWPTKKIPEIIGNSNSAIKMLIKEFLFVTLFKACSESLASENYSRLGAMERAEKNIEELLDTISHTYHRLRQSSIDEELFDVVSGFEALKEKI